MESPYPTSPRQQIPVKTARSPSSSSRDIPSTHVSSIGLRSNFSGSFSQDDSLTQQDSPTLNPYLNFDSLRWNDQEDIQEDLVPVEPVEYDEKQLLVTVPKRNSPLRTSMFLNQLHRVNAFTENGSLSSRSDHSESNHDLSYPSPNKSLPSPNTARQQNDEDIVESLERKMASMEKEFNDELKFEREKKRLKREIHHNESPHTFRTGQVRTLCENCDIFSKKASQLQEELDRTRRHLSETSILERENENYMKILHDLREQKDELQSTTRSMKIHHSETQTADHFLGLEKDFQIEQQEHGLSISKDEIARLNGILDEIIPLAFPNDRQDMNHPSGDVRELTMRERAWNEEVADIKKQKLPAQLKSLLEDKESNMAETRRKLQHRIIELEDHITLLKSSNDQLETQVDEESKKTASIESLNDEYEENTKIMLNHYHKLCDRIRNEVEKLKKGSSQMYLDMSAEEADAGNTDNNGDRLPASIELEKLLWHIERIHTGLTDDLKLKETKEQELLARNNELQDTVYKRKEELKTIAKEREKKDAQDNAMLLEMNHFIDQIRRISKDNHLSSILVEQKDGTFEVLRKLMPFLLSVISRMQESLDTTQLQRHKEKMECETEIERLLAGEHSTRHIIQDILDRYRPNERRSQPGTPVRTTTPINPISEEVRIAFNLLEDILENKSMSIREMEIEQQHLYNAIEESSSLLSKFVDLDKRDSTASEDNTTKKMKQHAFDCTQQWKEALQDMNDSIPSPSSLARKTEKQKMEIKVAEERLSRALAEKVFHMYTAEACLYIAELKSTVAQQRSMQAMQNKLEEKMAQTSAKNRQMSKTITQGKNLLRQLVLALEKYLKKDVSLLPIQMELTSADSDLEKKTSIFIYIQHVTMLFNEMKSDYRQSKNFKKALIEDIHAKTEQMEQSLEEKEQELIVQVEVASKLREQLALFTSRVRALEDSNIDFRLQQHERDMMNLFSHISQSNAMKGSFGRKRLSSDVGDLEERIQTIGQHVWRLFKMVEHSYKVSQHSAGEFGIEQQNSMLRQEFYDILGAFKNVITSEDLFIALK